MFWESVWSYMAIVRIGRKFLLVRVIRNETIIPQLYSEVCTFYRSVICRKFSRLGEY